MSLQIAAKHLASKGRGPDDTLVHMSRDEVKSLSDLAMAHGGQLSINPETGLPEAGFLSAILPMVAGAALGPAGVGLTAMQAGLLVGAGSYLMNPRAGLMGGLMAGLGGYGGAGLGAGLRDIATSEAGLTSTGASMDYAAQNAEAIKNAQAFEQAKLAEAAKYTSPNYMDVGGTGSNYLPFGGSGGLNVTAPTSVPIGADYEHVLSKGNLLQNPLTGSQLGQSATGFDAMSRGAKSLFTDPTAEKFKTLGGGDYMGLAKTGAAALAPAAPALMKPTGLNVPTASQKQTVPHYRYEPGVINPTPVASATGVENMYFPGSRYTALTNEQAQQLYPGYPAANYAGGGPVEQMSNANAIGANTGFPQADLHNPAYSTPYQIPLSQNVVTGPSDTRVDPFTGEMKFADGGATPYSAEYYPGYSGYGGTTSSSTSGSNSGSPTGSAIGDLGYAISNQSISPVAAAIAQAAMDALSPTSPTSVNAVSGLDAQSDAAAVGAPSVSSVSDAAPGMGGDAPSAPSGDSSEANGGLVPHSKYHMARGGLSDAYYNLGGYSDGGRLLRGPGDGVSDSIPATIGKKQPARLADGEFVVPARIVSEIGNGSTEAGARKLYAMMDRVQAARRKTVGKNKVAHNTRADKYLPA